MSTPFYDLASLVIQPSGVKAQKVYAQKPMTTDGQLTFSRASTATRVNASGLIEEVASNVPRLDYTNSTCPKLLLEPSRTNLLLQSSAFDNASWVKTQDGQVTITANAAVAPNGTTTAEKMIPSAIAGFHCVQQLLTLSAGKASMSVYAKAAENSFLQIFDALTTEFVNFNLTTGAVGSSSVYVGSIEDAGNGWYRCTATKDVPSGNFTPRIAVVTSATAVRGESFTGNGTDGLLIWGAQLEAGAYPTSLINTTTAAVTRLAESASKTGIASLIGQSEGTLFVDFTIGRTPSSTDRVAILNDGTGNERIGISLGATGLLYMFVVDGGATQAEIIRTGTTAGTYKVAAAYKANDFVFYVNGVQVGTDTAGTIPSCSRLDIGNQLGVGQLGGGVNQALLFPTRLTNAELAELTTL
jgi:hypothetical protein